ncbi:MAG: exodeoxyribonuclease VII large subunit [Nitrococcus sp.]|nr:exodeoxyribonuclease VII large subunit [Nitrococcus sp.]
MSEPHALGLDTRRDVYTVSRLNQEVRLLLDNALPLLWVEGEISNLSQPRSGHLYFTLKDEAAQVRCAMFRNRSLHLRFQPKESLHVLVRARVSLYAPRGDFQLIVEHMEDAGDGALRRAFEVLKTRLANEGLFAAEHKKPLPSLPRRLGVITSPSAAALRDVLTVIQRRFPAIRVLIYPVAVQGVKAPQEIAAMIQLASRRREVDALLLTRGGGSLEDLWAFNEEAVARAIYECTIPIVNAVGHETDTTIADFVADQRAPTPSAAAELLSPDGAGWLARIDQLGERLQRYLRREVDRQIDAHDRLARRLANQHPGRRLQERAQRLDELEQRITRAERERLRELALRNRHLADRLQRQDPRERIRARLDQVLELRRRLQAAFSQSLHNRRQLLSGTLRALEAISPLKTLERGYAIVRREQDDRIVRRHSEVAPGERISARLYNGELICRVEALREGGDAPTLCTPQSENEE